MHAERIADAAQACIPNCEARFGAPRFASVHQNNMGGPNLL